MESNVIDKLFEKQNRQWDVQQLDPGHFDRFSKKLHLQKRKRNLNSYYAVAATVAVILSLVFVLPKTESQTELRFASKETKQTDSIFSAMIQRQVMEIKVMKSAENHKIVEDALLQIKALDRDYERIKQELEQHGECEPIVYAMVSNLQTRVSFLENVQANLLQTKKINKIDDENSI